MSYIVKNCPCFVLGVAIKGNEKKVQTCNNYRIRELTHCSDIADCVIKQVIEKCKLFQNNYLVNNGVQMLTANILNSFDIEEINK